METRPQIEISEDLNAQLTEVMKISDLSKEEIVREVLEIGLPHFASQFQPPPLWLEERIREALAEPPQLMTREQFDKHMTDIINGD